MSIRSAVIGVGHLGRHHARIYSESKAAQLVGIVDTNAEAARQYAEMYGCESFSDYRDVLDKADVISIVTPTIYHHSVAMDCLRAGKDLLIEKPITTTIAEADEIIAEADRRGAIVQVGHLERYNPAVKALYGMIGKPTFLEARRVSPFKGRATDVDVTLDLMIHDIDIIISLLNDEPIADIKVTGASVITEKLDVAKAWIEFRNGVSSLITVSRISEAAERTLQVHQKNGFLKLDFAAMSITRSVGKGQAIESETIEVEKKEPLKEEIEDFLSAVAQRRQPLVSAVHGRRALEVTLEITEKIKGKIIS